MNWAEAVKLAKEGKEEGYEFLYHQTYQKCYYVALKYMKQEDAAADVVQDAYIKAFSSLDQLQDPEKFAGWLSRIVATKALDELRKKKAVLFSQLQADNEEISMEELLADARIDTQPELALDQEETSRLVREMIDTLSEEQRMCIVMFYIEQIPVKNIAQILGVSENTVKSRLKYGRDKIEDKVLELEKKGTKLYGIAPFPFFLYLLLHESMSAKAAPVSLDVILKAKTVPVKSGKGIAAKAASITIKKYVIGIAAGLVVCGGAAAVVHFVTERNADRQETVYEVQTEETQEMNTEEDSAAALQPNSDEAKTQGTDAQQADKQEIQEAETSEEETSEEETSEGESSEGETNEGETQETDEQEEDSTDGKWLEAYLGFADSLQTDGNGYALLEVSGCDVPILVVMPDMFYLAVDNNTFGYVQTVTQDSRIYRGCYWLQLYFYDAEADEVTQINSADSGSPNGALIDGYMETGYYLTYLPGEKLLVGDLVGSSVVIETYSFHAETGNLQGMDTYVNENADTVERKDILYYRSIEQASENIGAVQE